MMRLICLSLAMVLMATVLPGVNATAQDRDRTRDQDILMLKEQIHKDTKLPPSEVDAIDPELRQYMQLKGDGGRVREMARIAVQNNCTGSCLGEMIRTMNRAMAQGMTAKEAQAMVSSALREQIRERDQQRLQLNEQELGERIRNRVDAQLERREQMREKSMQREEMKSMEREMGRGMGSDGEMKGGRR